jgi:photosystem II stability/assembly factor-like uncharacterized protein
MTTKNLARARFYLVFTIIAALTAAGASAQEWQPIAFPDGGDLTGVCFVHADTGFVVTNGGLLGRTYDGGRNWRLIKVTPSVALEDVSFLSGNLGFVCGRAGSLYGTIDGGENWDNHSLDDTIPWLFDVEMLDAKHILAAGATRSQESPIGGLLLRSDDGGRSFDRGPVIGVGYREFFYRFGQPIYLLTMGALSRSDDLGENWESGLTIDGKPGRALSFAGEAGLIAGPRGMVAISRDSGQTWRSYDRTENEVYIAAELIDENTGYIGGWPEIILKTTDGGRTWTEEPFEPKFNVLDFCLVADRLYAVGSAGGIAVKKVK